MNSRDIKKKVKQFKREYGISGHPDRYTLEAVFEKQGFTIIEYSFAVNDPDVETLIQSLNLSDLTNRSNGFLYVDENFRLVFINDKLSEEERWIVLAHEEGHYYCGHVDKRRIVGHNVEEEYEANEFTHYLLYQPINNQIKRTFHQYRIAILIVVLLLILLCVSYFSSRIINERRLYEGEYYVTATGDKYHLGNCITIEGHKTRRLTKKDIESGNYQPCGVCMPDNN